MNAHVIAILRNALLKWYGTQKRDLPWRRINTPYAICVSEFMLQQTTVATVLPYFERFINTWPSWQALTQANEEDIMHVWQGLGYYRRARHLHLCAKAVVASGEELPKCTKKLIKFPGIGPYTASAIASIAFDQQSVPVDGNVIRVIGRLFALTTPLPKLQKEVQEITKEFVGERPGDFAQALMELGALICKPRHPQCTVCPLQEICQGRKNALDYPVKAIAKERLKKMGYVYCLKNHNQDLWLIKKDEGLLSGLYGCPTSDWQTTLPPLTPPIAGHWHETDHHVLHIFTHFSLTLRLVCGQTNDVNLPYGVWMKSIKDYPLSSLMKKVIQVWKRL